MWNYPFDPEEIEGENYESPLWESALVVLGGFALIYFGTHLAIFIFN